jgi:hypothetical protein
LTEFPAAANRKAKRGGKSKHSRAKLLTPAAAIRQLLKPTGTVNLKMSLAEIQSAIEQLSFEERAKLAAWLHGWKDDEWDEQMKRDVANGKFDDVVREVEDDIKAGRLRDMP